MEKNKIKQVITHRILPFFLVFAMLSSYIPCITANAAISIDTGPDSGTGTVEDPFVYQFDGTVTDDKVTWKHLNLIMGYNNYGEQIEGAVPVVDRYEGMVDGEVAYAWIFDGHKLTPITDSATYDASGNQINPAKRPVPIYAAIRAIENSGVAVTLAQSLHNPSTAGIDNMEEIGEVVLEVNVKKFGIEDGTKLHYEYLDGETGLIVMGTRETIVENGMASIIVTRTNTTYYLLFDGASSPEHDKIESTSQSYAGNGTAENPYRYKVVNRTTSYVTAAHINEVKKEKTVEIYEIWDGEGSGILYQWKVDGNTLIGEDMTEDLFPYLLIKEWPRMAGAQKGIYDIRVATTMPDGTRNIQYPGDTMDLPGPIEISFNIWNYAREGGYENSIYEYDNVISGEEEKVTVTDKMVTIKIDKLGDYTELRAPGTYADDNGLLLVDNSSSERVYQTASINSAYQGDGSKENPYTIKTDYYTCDFYDNFMTGLMGLEPVSETVDGNLVKIQSYKKTSETKTAVLETWYHNQLVYSLTIDGEQLTLPEGDMEGSRSWHVDVDQIEHGVQVTVPENSYSNETTNSNSLVVSDTNYLYGNCKLSVNMSVLGYEDNTVFKYTDSEQQTQTVVVKNGFVDLTIQRQNTNVQLMEADYYEEPVVETATPTETATVIPTITTTATAIITPTVVSTTAPTTAPIIITTAAPTISATPSTELEKTEYLSAGTHTIQADGFANASIVSITDTGTFSEKAVVANGSITFTAPQSGTYTFTDSGTTISKVRLKGSSISSTELLQENVVLKGTGTEENPYVILADVSENFGCTWKSLNLFLGYDSLGASYLGDDKKQKLMLEDRDVTTGKLIASIVIDGFNQNRTPIPENQKSPVNFHYTMNPSIDSVKTYLQGNTLYNGQEEKTNAMLEKIEGLLNDGKTDVMMFDRAAKFFGPITYSIDMTQYGYQAGDTVDIDYIGATGGGVNHGGTDYTETEDSWNVYYDGTKGKDTYVIDKNGYVTVDFYNGGLFSIKKVEKAVQQTTTPAPTIVTVINPPVSFVTEAPETTSQPIETNVPITSILPETTSTLEVTEVPVSEITKTPETTEVPIPESSNIPEKTETPVPETTNTPTPEPSRTPEMTKTPTTETTKTPEVTDIVEETDTPMSEPDTNTENTSLKTVTNLKITKKSSGSIKLTWAKSDTVNGYQIYLYNKTKKQWVLLHTITKNTTHSYLLKDLKIGKTYQFKVRAYLVVDGEKEYGSFSTKKKIMITPDTTKLTVKVKKTTAILHWKKADNSSGYEIFRADTKKGSYKKIKTITNKAQLGYQDKKLNETKKYYYKVRSYKIVNGKKVYSKFSNIMKKS